MNTMSGNRCEEVHQDVKVHFMSVKARQCATSEDHALKVDHGATSTPNKKEEDHTTIVKEYDTFYR